MPRKFYPNAPKCTAPSFDQLLKPTENALATAHPLMAKGNRPLQMNFEQQLRALVYFHLEEHTSGRHLIQDGKLRSSLHGGNATSRSITLSQEQNTG